MTAALAVSIEVSDSILGVIHTMITWSRNSAALPSPIVTDDIIQDNPEKSGTNKEKGNS
jgi:hypothetical protein